MHYHHSLARTIQRRLFDCTLWMFSTAKGIRRGAPSLITPIQSKPSNVVQFNSSGNGLLPLGVPPSLHTLRTFLATGGPNLSRLAAFENGVIGTMWSFWCCTNVFLRTRRCTVMPLFSPSRYSLLARAFRHASRRKPNFDYPKVLCARIEEKSSLGPLWNH